MVEITIIKRDNIYDQINLLYVIVLNLFGN